MEAAHRQGRDALNAFFSDIKKNVYENDIELQHCIQFYYKNNQTLHNELLKLGEKVASELEPLVNENNLDSNLPRLEKYDAVGNRVDKIVHHPNYAMAGDIIYGTGLLKKLLTTGQLSECLALFFVSSQAGEAGHHCPIACSAGIIRVLQKTNDFPSKQEYLNKLTSPSYRENYTGAQFITEIQGGSDVGLNATYAKQDENDQWRIFGEKWFCSNADAELIFLTARYDESIEGTKGLGLFLVPNYWGKFKNHYSIRRLKNKIGTRSMATAEVRFNGAVAIAIGKLNDGFNIMMNNVLHVSRLFNSFSVLAMVRRALTIANCYANHRYAFSHPIIHFPLVSETLQIIKSENDAMTAGTFRIAKLQDECDQNENKKQSMLLRLLVNMQKYYTSFHSVNHLRLLLGVLAGNGTIETFSSIPRLLRDSIVCETWEGAHNVLMMQILKDIHKYQIDDYFIGYMKEEVKKVNSDTQFYQHLLDLITLLAKHLSAFKKLSPTVQSFKIKHIIDEMAICFNALMLLQEAEDFLIKENNKSKINSLMRFLNLHEKIKALPA